jgi:YVTN family beta-propeller protein
MLLPTLLALAVSACAQPVCLVLLKGANALAYYSRDGKLLASVAVGQHPHEMAFSPDRKLVYITDHGGNTVSIVDIAAKRRIGTIDLGKYRAPRGIDVDPRTGRIAVSTEAPDQLLLLDPVKRSIVRTFDNKGRQPHMVTLGPGGKWAYVSNTEPGHVAAINLDNGELKKMQTEAGPQGSVVSKDGRELYVTNSGAASITVIDTGRNQAIAHIPTGKGPNRIALTPDGSTLVYSMSGENKMGIADPKIRTQLDYVLLPNRPVSCTLSGDGSVAFLSAEAQDTIYIVSVKNRKIAGEIRTAKGAAPDRVLETMLP